MHGLHRVSHFLCPDGSGRDLNIFWDGCFKQGRLNGYDFAASDHPLFKTLSVNRILTDDDEFTDVFGKKPKHSVSLQEASRRSLREKAHDDWNKASYKARGGSVLMLPKVARPDPAAPPKRLLPHVPLRPKTTESSPTSPLYRSKSSPGTIRLREHRNRECQSSFDSWANKNKRW
mmetsp:Transcript_58777/g.91387  ORF Transcript_58777/g.91387 Transcript_58777/m.91387 type:complete len:175 (-) Transcript_58777:7-531(-)